MTAIPINPSMIANAINYATPLLAQNSLIGEKPIDQLTGKVQKYIKYIPMQVSYVNAPGVYIDLSNVSTSNPFTQVASMYVDNSASAHDVTIYFPDSGWQTRIAFGDTAMINPITGQKTPKFYVLLDSGDENSATDITNIFAIDTFIPPSLTSTYQRSVSYGYSQFFTLQPVFSQSSAFVGGGTLEANTPLILIPNTQWYLTSIDLSLLVITDDAAVGTISLLDAGVAFLRSNFSYPSTSSGLQMLIDLYSQSALNYISSGNGALTVVIDNLTNISTNVFTANLFGGVLIN